MCRVTSIVRLWGYTGSGRHCGASTQPHTTARLSRSLRYLEHVAVGLNANDEFDIFWQPKQAGIHRCAAGVEVEDHLPTTGRHVNSSINMQRHEGGTGRLQVGANVTEGNAFLHQGTMLTVRDTFVRPLPVIHIENTIIQARLRTRIWNK